MKLNGFAAPVMLGLLAATAATSIAMGNKAKENNEKQEQKYIQEKQEYIRNLAKSLENVVSTESSYDGTVTTDRLTKYYYTNTFDVNTGVGANSQGSDGSKLTAISNDSNSYNRNTNSSATGTGALTIDGSGKTSVVYSEDKARQEQIYKSYTNMKEQAASIYKDIIASKDYTFPDSVTSYKQDAWKRDFSYVKESDSKAQLSFNLPWDTGTEKLLPINLPVIPNDLKIKQLYFGVYNNAYILTTQGEVWVTGSNTIGQLGIGSTTNQTSWVKTSLSDVKELYIGEYRTAYALTNNGEVWVTGMNLLGQLGLGNKTNQSNWVQTSLSNIKKIYLGDCYTAYALSESGEVWVTGTSARGQLGIGVSGVSQTSWVQTSLSSIKEIYTGFYDFAFALSESGEVWAAGRNDYGQLGLGNTTDQTSWVKTSLSNVKKIYTGHYYNSYALKDNGEVWVAGYNTQGNLGVGNTTNQTSWVQTSLLDIKELYIGYDYFAYALTNSGDVWATGRNSYGQLGIGNTTTQTSWVKTSLSNIQEIYGGYRENGYALTSTGGVWAAGRNNYGQLGLGAGAIGNQVTWAETSLTDVQQIDAAYGANAFALKDNGEVWVAGYNNYGQLGVGSTTNQSSWVKVSLSDVKLLYSGKGYNTYAFTNSEELFGVGRNNNGQLGAGNTTDQTSWVKTVGEGATVIE